MSENMDFVLDGEGEFYAMRGWHSAKRLRGEVLSYQDWTGGSLRELLYDWKTPLAELRKEWTAGVTRGWLRLSTDEDVDSEWAPGEAMLMCDKDHPKAEKWTYWQA